MKVNKKILKSACYTVSVTMALVSNVPPLLFLTFREMYGISFSLLGLLVVVNICFSTNCNSAADALVIQH